LVGKETIAKKKMTSIDVTHKSCLAKMRHM
jgi:hypothetical protein